MDHEQRKALIRLAYTRPELRPAILPLVQDTVKKAEAEEAPEPEGTHLASFASASGSVAVDAIEPVENGKFHVKGNVHVVGMDPTPFQGHVNIDTAQVVYEPGLGKKASAEQALLDAVVGEILTRPNHHAELFTLALRTVQ